MTRNKVYAGGVNLLLVIRPLPAGGEVEKKTVRGNPMDQFTPVHDDKEAEMAA
jgi:hypothetical protein